MMPHILIIFRRYYFGLPPPLFLRLMLRDDAYACRLLMCHATPKMMLPLF